MTRLIVGNGARNLSKARTENNRQRGYCSEVHRRFSGRRGGDQSHPRVRNYEFMQLPLVVMEKQNRPTITEAEISAMLTATEGTRCRLGRAGGRNRSTNW